MLHVQTPRIVQRFPACKIKVLDSVPNIFESCRQFVFACRREKTTHPEVALDLSPTIVTGTTVGVSYCFHSTKKKSDRNSSAAETGAATSKMITLNVKSSKAGSETTCLRQEAGCQLPVPWLVDIHLLHSHFHNTYS